MINRFLHIFSFRFIRAAFAHSYGLCVSVFSIVLTPWICLAHWDSAGFGFWIIASSVSCFFVISDGGISYSLGNYLVIKCNGRVDINKAVSYVLKISIVRLFKVYFVLGLFVAVLWGLGKYRILTVELVDLAISSMFLCYASGLQSFLNINEGILRAGGRNSTGIAISNTVRFFEALVVFVAVVNGAGIVSVAFFVFVVKFFLSTFFMLKSFRSVGGALGNELWRISTVEELSRSGFGFASNFIATNIFLHGTPLVASIIGPSYAAILATTRTVTRIPSMFSSIFYMALSPEVSDLFRDGNIVYLRKMARRMVFISLLFTVVIEVVVFFNIDFLEQKWLHGKVAIDHRVFAVLAGCAIMNVTWQAGAQILGALNATFHFGLVYLFLSIVSISLAIACVLSNVFGIVGVVFITLVSDVFMNYIVWNKINDLLVNKNVLRT